MSPFLFLLPNPPIYFLLSFKSMGSFHSLFYQNTQDSGVPLKFIFTWMFGTVSSVLGYFLVFTATNVEVFILVIV